MNRNKKLLISLREKALEASIGSKITCPSCNMVHVKTAYNTVFCKNNNKTKCKDNYWNNVDPTKRNNRTRISPASANFLASQSNELRPMDTRAIGKFQGYTSEGYRVFNGIAFDEFDDAVYNIDPNEDDNFSNEE